ncbi:hypothetical protein ASPNIDRAFT_43722 [Aspergillus niger ATCC 1015]|uniref:Contig An12c0060, genomic contig n=4 Tax=Aspergillus TaxID=5052 RepID=A2QYM5_ASPNC|nr:uncharacterized protein BO96DRAFT_481932 [Aspergillus niger CBS 101883]XP_059605527.1 uncharacterized protein An12g01780 [Aspergillus niger]EHA25866.1 hypothetical protein ASPNIDRAFT_43722 [Aspergillus niger ATCC 1015]RDH20725.1 hypothetical protein M747DRAFT_350565 [Aspergillus niger ATCC 13496]RDK42477.1 hypothetical protein M752DRAFT_300736 [Aspergillus phoenicis ATCC 13157]PYH53683.1 hypothetical protein BO96DRAFT_481932 [Aspergillus niger CBS 101883]CAK48460.1 unnamed protein product 
MLNNIPNEILLDIIPFFTPSDFTRLVLVCKAWYIEFIPYLYNHVSLPLNEYDHLGTTYGMMPESHLPVRRFTQTMITNPSLAPLIRSLELYPSDCKEGKWKQLPALEPLPEERYRHLMLPYGEAKHKHRRKFYAWRRDLRENSERMDYHRVLHHFEDAWLALLLVQLRNLEKLGIALPEEVWIGGYEDGPFPPRRSPHFERVIAWASHPKLGVLTKLSHISLTDGPCIWESELSVHAIPLTRLLPFLRIPSLRKLYVFNPCDRSPLSIPKDLTIPLTHLDFHVPKEAMPNLPHFLKRCSMLESFTLQQQGWCEYYSRYWQNLPQLYQSLQRSRSSIRHLNLTFCDWNVWQDAKTPKPVFFGPLSDFPILESIRIRWGNLLQFTEERGHTPVTPLWQLLPCSLKHLFIDHCLLQCSEALYTELVSLMIHCSTHVPCLRKLYLRFAERERAPTSSPEDIRTKRMTPDSANHDRLLALRLDFGALNVDFQVFQGDKKVTFYHEYCIRKKWPRGKDGEVFVL